MNKETIDLTREMSSEVKTVLGAIADQLGLAVDHFYPVFVQQQVVEGMFGLCGTLLMIIMFVVSVIAAVKYSKTFVTSGSEQIPLASLLFGGVALILGLICLIRVCDNNFMRDDFTKVFNPEYHAVKEITQLLPGRATK